ncbi:MAG: hypothetical protein EOP84_26950 [Verrucomicrobiaceae bacterium]|nr:MAG: hypothetical protein EOP84_26950 [Verrucomicrobiaceae bacterium]
MPPTFDLILKGGSVATPGGIAITDVAISDGKIAGIGAFDGAQAGEVFEAHGLHVLPGVIDSQVHFREPGLEWKEDLESGSRAALFGGVTSFLEMPNTNPTTTDEASLRDKLSRVTHVVRSLECLLSTHQTKKASSLRIGSGTRVSCLHCQIVKVTDGEPQSLLTGA